jgi:tripartite-type tricarboxylate transporter receptor subunit TctC
MLCQPVADSMLRAHGRPPKSCLKSKDVPETSAKILTEAIRKTLQEPKLQENLKSRGYNVDLRTTPAGLNKLVKEEIEKYARFTPQDLSWKAQ